MSQIHVEASRVVDARPETIYAILSDYRVGHPAILPEPYFGELNVLQGGQGAGTVVETTVTVMGIKQHYHLVVSEPQPGRVLMETDDAVGVTTTFTVEPVGNGSQTRVTIASDSRLSPGFKGFMERLMNPSVMHRIYNAELEKLAVYVRGR